MPDRATEIVVGFKGAARLLDISPRRHTGRAGLDLGVQVRHRRELGGAGLAIEKKRRETENVLAPEHAVGMMAAHGNRGAVLA